MSRPPLARRVVRHLHDFRLELVLVATLSVVLWFFLLRLIAGST